MTGIGMEHPVENGFAFLNPYGLPYLPGSSVKGILRRSAEDLALAPKNERKGWDLLAVWLLFGFDAQAAYLRAPANQTDDSLRDAEKSLREAYITWVDEDKRDSDVLDFFMKFSAGSVRTGRSEDEERKLLRSLMADHEAAGESLTDGLHLRGAIRFWDVMVELANNKLDVDITNPHYQHYYQDQDKGPDSPHDAGKPSPIQFLVVSSNSIFRFHFECSGGLPIQLHERWHDLVDSALDHAFDWFGFGAKTALGYGAMRRDKTLEESARRNAEDAALRIQNVRQEQEQRECEKREQEAKLAAMDPVDRMIEDILEKRKDSNQGENLAILAALQDGTVQEGAKFQVAKRLKKRMQDEGSWREDSRNPHKDKKHKRTRQVMEILRPE